jgi:tetratricopeptide (TPR) repeat protein
VIVLAALAAYHNSFQGPFIFDDLDSILDNQTIRHVWPIGDALVPPRQSGVTGRPVVNLSLAVNYAFGGTRVWGYHVLNLVIHVLAGLTFFGIVRRTLLWPRLRERFGAEASKLALATAVLWTVHPLQTESVTYVIQRCESMMGLFYLLTLYYFIRGASSERARPWFGLSVAACALGTACKEVMLSAPLMVLLYDRTFVSGSFRVAWQQHGRLLVALGATWVLLGSLSASGGSLDNVSRNPHIRLGRGEYLLTEPGVILDYLRLCVWPHPLCFDYNGLAARTWSSILPPALVVGTLLTATVWALGVNAVWGFVGAWFFLILAPTSSFFRLDSPMYEHRMYLPLAAVVTMAVVGLFLLQRQLFSRQQGLVLSCVAGTSVAILFGYLTIQRNRDYSSEVSIWQDTVDKRPNSARAHFNLGTALEQAGRVQEAIEHYEQALRIKPDFADAHSNLGVALAQQGRLQEAIEHWEESLRINPDSADAHFNLGLALARTGRVQEAIEHWEQTLRIKPNYPEAHYNLGLALEKLGRTQEAITHYEQALRIKPDFVQAQNALARARAAQ